jgi:hypothetical protein
MHADEKNEGLSLLRGKDIYDYHMYVITLPVVDKEVRFKKQSKAG